MRCLIIVAGVSTALSGCAGPAPRDGATSVGAASHEAPDEWVPSRVITSNDGRWRVGYRTTPGPVVSNEPFAIDVRVEASLAEPMTSGDVALAADAAMPDHSHGMNVEPKVTSRGRGVFLVEGMDFHMPGRWELYFDITRDGRTSRAQDEITLE